MAPHGSSLYSNAQGVKKLKEKALPQQNLWVGFCAANGRETMFFLSCLKRLDFTPDFCKNRHIMVVSPISDSENSRLVAARIVSSWLKSRIFPDHELDAVETSRAFIMEIVLGVVRWYGVLSWIRDRRVPQKPRPEVDACILVGLYQLLFMDDVQEYAVVNETVEAAKTVGGRTSPALSMPSCAGRRLKKRKSSKPWKNRRRRSVSRTPGC